MLPPSMRLPAIKDAHGPPLAGHDGVYKTKERILQSYWWSGMDRDIDDHIKACHRCQIRKRDPKRNPCRSQCRKQQNWTRGFMPICSGRWSHPAKTRSTFSPSLTPSHSTPRLSPFPTKGQLLWPRHCSTNGSADTESRLKSSLTKGKSFAISFKRNSSNWSGLLTWPLLRTIRSATAKQKCSTRQSLSTSAHLSTTPLLTGRTSWHLSCSAATLRSTGQFSTHCSKKFFYIIIIEQLR